ncbi:MAG: ABC transporter permease [Dehalococcoidales bacterium]|nr:ABC transporter permease [Dehalococcoidales bacterium]
MNNKTQSIEIPKSSGSQFWVNTKRLMKIPLAVFGFIVIILIVFCAIFAPLISPYDPNAQSKNYLKPPSSTNLLGTDQLGRDVLTRTIFGSRIALIVSLGAVSLGIVIGVPLGLIAGNSRGWVDEVIMRLMDALLSFPSLIIAIGLVAVLGSTLLNVILAIGIANVPFIARIVRAQALSVREQPYIMASHSIGASSWRVIFRHILPNSMAPVIVQGTLGMAYAILTEAALGFLGLGVPPPTPTWGNMLQFAFPVLDRAAYLSIVPGIAIFLLVLAFNFTGDALRDVLDPRLRGLFR